MADEFRKGDESYFYPYFQSMPSREDYMEYHPGMARYAGKHAWERCVEEKGQGKRGLLLRAGYILVEMELSD